MLICIDYIQFCISFAYWSNSAVPMVLIERHRAISPSERSHRDPKMVLVKTSAEPGSMRLQLNVSDLTVNPRGCICLSTQPTRRKISLQEASITHRVCYR